MKCLLLFLLCLGVVSLSYSQKPLAPTIDENTVVLDSEGTAYPFMIWQRLVAQGDYKIMRHMKPGEEAVFILTRLTDQEKLSRLERIPKPRESDYFKVGKDFGNFKGSTITEESVNTKNEKGKILVINFWFVDCPPCRKEIPELNALVEKFRDNKNVRFLAIALDGKSDVKFFLKNSPYNYEVIYSGSYISQKFNVKSYPTHVVVDGDNKIRFSATGYGPGTVHWLKKAIEELIPGEITKN